MKHPVLTASMVLAGCLLMVFAIVRSQEIAADGASQQAYMGDLPVDYQVGSTDSGRAVVEFQYDHDSVAAVQEMAASMTEQTQEAVEDGDTVEGEIVFAHPIPVDDYLAFMADLGLTPTSNRIEGETWGGGWMGLTAPPADDGAALDWPLLKSALENDKDGTHVVGVVTALGVQIDRPTFNALVDHPWVFAISSMASWIDNEIVVKYPNVDVTRMYVQQSLLYGWMKKVGIAKPYVHLDYTGTFREYPYSSGNFRLTRE